MNRVRAAPAANGCPGELPPREPEAVWPRS
jgi:hypothetical protein